MECESRRSGGGGCFSCCFGKDGEGGELGQRAARALRMSSRWVLDRAAELVARAARRRRKHQQKQQLAGEFRRLRALFVSAWKKAIGFGYKEAQPSSPVTSFSIAIVANPLSLSYVIVERKIKCIPSSWIKYIMLKRTIDAIGIINIITFIVNITIIGNVSSMTFIGNITAITFINICL
ncbi:hypothetical protein E2562_034287 [Oryza meyeriana var. granulata]|uniref:Uncharacterized protein n=1 Tax=Oryza meyeriana var. granulata TaxID=110450 RepID=A0A6G1DAY4_9ORYZ|nr:hypothetical protein E2562_034287 [Oryza meyeriana var. granulata]